MKHFWFMLMALALIGGLVESERGDIATTIIYSTLALISAQYMFRELDRKGATK